ncbi:MAG: M42 family metallopeptidase [Phycisphaerales bacterium]|nr:MAG: M42 family metallopeptidase [Phycisphaerales bacterium]
MRQASYKFLKAIQETPSPSGFEQPVQRIVRKYIAPYADEVRTDVHGNVIASLNHKAPRRVMLAGHCDQIGMMVNYIDENGYLFFKQIGGIDPSVLPGSRVVLHTKHGPVDGVVGRKPIHTMKQEERGAKIELRDMWIDIGVKGKKEAQQVVAVGDPVTFQLEMVHLGRNLVTSPGFDNKCGTFVVMEALRLCSIKKIKCALFAVSTVQEEVGLRGARTSGYGIDPQVGIAVDVTHATDYPDIDKRVNGELKIGGGPTISTGPNINPRLEAMLIAAAKSKRIAYQMEAAPSATGTDANAIQLTRAGVATALMGIPNRYMHTPVEVVSLSDLEAAAKLLAETVSKIDQRTNFIPK